VEEGGAPPESHVPNTAGTDLRWPELPWSCRSLLPAPPGRAIAARAPEVVAVAGATGAPPQAGAEKTDGNDEMEPDSGALDG
jgi:hypothetical protein